MKPDEAAFLFAVATRCCVPYSPTYCDLTPRDLINDDGFAMHHKRAWGILEKWCRKRWYEYGVSLDLGWLTEAGLAAAALLPAPPPHD